MCVCAEITLLHDLRKKEEHKNINLMSTIPWNQIHHELCTPLYWQLCNAKLYVLHCVSVFPVCCIYITIQEIKAFSVLAFRHCSLIVTYSYGIFSVRSQPHLYILSCCFLLLSS